MSEIRDSLPLKTDRSRLRRAHAKGAHDRASLYALLASVPLCHIGHLDEGAPIVTPTLQWREGDRIYWHGSSKSRAMLRAADQPVCLTVTRLDGLVLARSGFEHSVNHASAMLFGTPSLVTDPGRKRHHLKAMFDHLYPGRWDQLRPMNDLELRATAVIGMDISEASVKTRAGPSDEPNEDRSWPVWAGTLPISWQTGPAEPDADNLAPLPEALSGYQFGRQA